MKTGAYGFNPPLGLAYIAAPLEQNNISVKILDANVLDLSAEDVVREAVEDGFTLVGVSVMTPVHNYAAKVARLLPDHILSVAGGPQASAIPEELLRDGFDLAIDGEGEATMLELASKGECQDVKGTCYIGLEGKMVSNPKRGPSDPNRIPLPARNLLINNGVDLPYTSGGTQFFPWARIFTSRSCPYDCNYCNKKIFGYKFKARTPENVLDEIIHLVEKYKVNEINIGDDCFNFDRDRALRIFDLINKENIKITLRFSNGLRADKIDLEFLKKAKKAGCVYIAYGIESGNENILKSIPKGVELDTFRKAVKLTKEEGIFVTGYFILGLLGDTRETMVDTINFAKELDLDVASFTIAVPYPGTKMWERVKENGEIRIKKWEDYHNTSGKMGFSYPGMADAETVEMLYKKAYREFYFRPKYIMRQLPKYLFNGHKMGSLFRGVKGLIFTQRAEKL